MRLLLAALLVGIYPLLARSKLNNVTIDDSDTTHITYLSKGGFNWNVGPCPECFLQPDPKQLLNGSWHEGLANGTNEKQIQIQFTGVAVYVYMATLFNALATTDVSFLLDGQPAGIFKTNSINPSVNLQNATIMYNQTVFAEENLFNTSHTLLISNENLGQFVDIVFDYFIYTASIPDEQPTTSANDGSATQPPQPNTSNNNNDSSKSSGSGNVGAIAGGVVGGVAVVIISGIIAFFLLRKRRQEREGGPPILGDTSILDHHRDRLTPDPWIGPSSGPNISSTGGAPEMATRTPLLSNATLPLPPGAASPSIHSTSAPRTASSGPGSRTGPLEDELTSMQHRLLELDTQAEINSMREQIRRLEEQIATSRTIDEEEDAGPLSPGTVVGRLPPPTYEKASRGRSNNDLNTPLV